MTWSLSAEERVSTAARVLRQNLGIRPGENVVIESWSHAVPWADAFVVAARKAGAHPLVLYESEPAFWDSIRGPSARTMGVLGRHELAVLETANAWVYLPGPFSGDPTTELSRQGVQVLDQWDDQWFRSAQRSGVRACRFELASTSEAEAAWFHVDLDAWRQELTRGATIDPPSLQRAARPIARLLARGRRITLSHPNGTRLDLGLRRVPPTVVDGRSTEASVRAGRIMTPIPAGEIVVALDERYAEGVFRSNRISRHYNGAFNGVRWSFHGGRLVDFEVTENAPIFEEKYRKGGPSRDRPALLSIGLNPELRDAPYYEDYQRGVVTLYVGRNADFGGRTRSPYRDFALLEGADVSVDGRKVVEGGALVPRGHRKVEERPS